MSNFTDVATAVSIPPQWVVSQFLPVGLTIVGGPPKSNKSLLTYAMAALCADYDSHILPADVKAMRKGPCLFISFEADAGVISHSFRVGAGVELREDGGLQAAMDPDEFRLDTDEGRKLLAEYLSDVYPRILVVDPLRDSHFVDENDSGAMIQVLRPLQRWAFANEAAVVVVHHASKMIDGETFDANRLRGSSAIFGKADAVLMLRQWGGREDAIRVKAKFKRGRAWERTLSLGFPGFDWQAHGEWIDDKKGVPR